MTKPLQLLTGLCVLTHAATSATINSSVAYFANETLNTIIAGNSFPGVTGSASGSLATPAGTSMTGLAGFDKGRFFASSTISRSDARSFSETLTSAVNFRDVLTIDTGGACPAGGSACRFGFEYVATGLYGTAGDIRFAEGQLDFAILNPLTPGNRSTWLVDQPAFLSPGPVRIVGSASVPFFDNQEFVFWPLFATVGRQAAGSSGTSVVDFANSLSFDSFSVSGPGGTTPSFRVSAESGLIYGRSGLSAVAIPEPGTPTLALVGSAVLWVLRPRRRIG